MDTVKNSIQQATDAVKSTTLSGTEPPSGIQGAGTAGEPYDQGNAPEQPPTVSGTEPPSGVKGKGTINEPYDQGNAPEQARAPDSEPPSGIQGKGTVSEPYDQGNQPEQLVSRVASKSPSNLPSPEDPLASPSTVHQGSGNPLMVPTKEQEKVISDTRGRDEAAQRTTSTPDHTVPSTGTAARGGNFDAARAGAGKEAERLKYEERDVSPGEMKDGTHAVTSGERGETYTPGKFNKLKDKFHIGRERR